MDKNNLVTYLTIHLSLLWIYFRFVLHEKKHERMESEITGINMTFEYTLWI